jgi:hypothetical protein
VIQSIHKAKGIFGMLEKINVTALTSFQELMMSYFMYKNNNDKVHVIPYQKVN